jgi:hypothetical protein
MSKVGSSLGFWGQVGKWLEGEIIGPTGQQAPANPLYPESGRKLPPLPQEEPDTSYDGCFFGGDNRAYPNNSPLKLIPEMAPSKGPVGQGEIVFLNGVAETAKGLSGEMQAVANATHTPVVGLYVATHGVYNDIVETVLDRVDQGSNAAVTTCTHLIYSRVKKNTPLRLFGFSHGAGVISRSLFDAQALLIKSGMTPAQVKQDFAKDLTVETVAGAAADYPDGPTYVHYTNYNDPIQLFSGVALGLTNPPNPFIHPGVGSLNIGFTAGEPGRGHSLSLYLPHYVPLAEVEALGKGGPNPPINVEVSAQLRTTGKTLFAPAQAPLPGGDNSAFQV